MSTIEDTTWEEEFNAMFGYLPADVQQKLRDMDPYDFGIMCRATDEDDKAQALEWLREEITVQWRAIMADTDFEPAPPSWRHMTKVVVHALILALARAGREEAGREPIEPGYERPAPTDSSSSEERTLIEALLRYRFGRLIMEFTSEPDERARRQARAADARRAGFTVINGDA
jgi:hypothetical protein